jgi:L-amino acid N-acyltransferase YncA
MRSIRIATAEEADAMLAIYEPYIMASSYTFETELPSREAFRQRVNNYLTNWPWLVCENDGEIEGYAYASSYRERSAYQWNVECSVYVNEKFQRSGTATSLYSILFELLKLQGFRTVYAVINLPNEKSVALHERFGFEWFANFENVGYKLGRWSTVGWWRLKINGYSENPKPPIKFRDLDHNLIRSIINKKQISRKEK